jgi:hypothetical protein
MGNAMVICSGSQYGWKNFLSNPQIFFSHLKNLGKYFLKFFLKKKKFYTSKNKEKFGGKEKLH